MRRHFRNATTDKRKLSSWSGWFGGSVKIAGKESRSKGRGRGLKGKPGFSGDEERGVRGDEPEGVGSPDVGDCTADSLGRFEERTSRSGT